MMRVRYLECQFILSKNIALNYKYYIRTWIHHSFIQISKQNITKTLVLSQTHQTNYSTEKPKCFITPT